MCKIFVSVGWRFSNVSVPWISLSYTCCCSASSHVFWSCPLHYGVYQRCPWVSRKSDLDLVSYHKFTFATPFIYLLFIVFTFFLNSQLLFLKKKKFVGEQGWKKRILEVQIIDHVILNINLYKFTTLKKQH